ncbi:hypothetical protein BDV26DRAFT_299153 [Aspergillus bertholletiae]|uniref:Nucleotide sugar dehydrogenase n=1 Tax=Aspergillus bertholletiae TaxID=1226010 RepID=A0A5N7AMF0_9EURO|nr:hypothetical protein BDV26DRAFT_299153 [Aspergillus bertholletiae]
MQVTPRPLYIPPLCAGDMKSILPDASCFTLHNNGYFQRAISESASIERNGLPTPPPEISSECRPEDNNVTKESLHTPAPDPIVAVIGVGYIGLELASIFAGVYNNIIAFDISNQRIEDIRVDLANKNIKATSNPSDIAVATHFLICVPTTLQHGCIDTTPLTSAIGLLFKYANPGSTVVIESSVAVGMTRQLLKDVIISRGLMAGMSPERVDPGRFSPAFKDIPKIISGLDDIAPGSLQSIQRLYGRVFHDLVPVSCPEVAEMTKLYENCQRMVCIAFANEMADACRSIGISAMEVSKAAATKPFGYQPYFPGLGVGGHCIPVNPYYLLSTSNLPLLRAATEKMTKRPTTLGTRAMKKFYCTQALDTKPRATRARVLVVGVGFKRGQSVLSNSPGLALIQHLRNEWEALVEYADPLVPQEKLPFIPKLDESRRWNVGSLSEEFDVILVAVDQPGLDLTVLRRLDGVLVENFTFSVAAGWSQ